MQRKARGVVSNVLVSLRQGAIREPAVEPPWSSGPAKFKVQTTRSIEVFFRRLGWRWLLDSSDKEICHFQELTVSMFSTASFMSGLSRIVTCIYGYIWIIEIILLRLLKRFRGTHIISFTSSSELSDTLRSGRGGSGFWGPVVVNLTHEMRRITFRLLSVTYYDHIQ